MLIIKIAALFNKKKPVFFGFLVWVLIGEVVLVVAVLVLAILSLARVVPGVVGVYNLIKAMVELQN